MDNRDTFTGYQEDPEEQKPKGPKQMLFVLIGPTRSGKSTLINTLLGYEVAEEGKEMSAHSTTR